ncbi:hypothetical protein E2F48_00620 [Arthrobacter crusticola]|uniref:Uncharacterized protein n=2 Tax=Arthrobacter crusticola TaxID=2547960 RepID=A0A4R5U218_9MICC|nr:hypothetical protein E2F48_00620 [Arthrobacter crusticola]
MRDTFDYLGEGHTLTGYVARQSLISAASPPTALLGEGKLASAFQNRSLDGDINSTLFRQVRELGPSADIFLIDLLSDRLGVYALPDKTYITNSRELRASGRLGSLEKGPSLIKFGTEKHFNLWKRAADKLVASINEVGLRERTLVMETPWASRTDTGEEVVSFRGMSASEAGELYRPYYTHLRRRGLLSKRLPDKLAVSSLTHKWGPEPYHYAPPAYEWMRDEILGAF